MFAARNAEPMAAPVHVQDDQQDLARDTASLFQVLEQLTHGKKMDIRKDVPVAFRSGVEKLGEALWARDEADLSRSVRFSLQASTAMAAVAKITGHVRTVSENAGTMSAAIEELNASIGQISETANTSSHEMEQAAHMSRDSSNALNDMSAATQEIDQSMTSMEERVNSLRAAAEQIGEFVGTIDAIASQTNLLALNATIEAARAGDAGRGFAVVASEVKSLSGQTQTATDDIRKRIERLTSDMQDLLQAMQGARTAINRGQELASSATEQVSQVQEVVSGNASRMSELAGVLAEQSTATGELSEGITRVANEANEASGNAQEVIDAVSSSEALVSEQFAMLDNRDIHDYVLHRAKSDHFLWKKNLSEMLVGMNNLTESELADHHSCRLGKWYGQVDDPSIRKHPAYNKLLDPHAAVHNHGKEAARRFAAGDVTGAWTSVLEMEKASDVVVKLLDELLDR